MGTWALGSLLIRNLATISLDRIFWCLFFWIKVRGFGTVIPLLAKQDLTPMIRQSV